MLIDKAARKSSGNKTRWTYSDDMVILENYKESSDKEIAGKLNGRHSALSVGYRIRKFATPDDKLSAIESFDELKEYHEKQGTFDGETEEAEVEENFDENE